MQFVDKHYLSTPFRPVSQISARKLWHVRLDRPANASNPATVRTGSNKRAIRDILTEGSASFGGLALSLCLALSISDPPQAFAYNVRLRDVENPAMQNGKPLSIVCPVVPFPQWQ